MTYWTIIGYVRVLKADNTQPEKIMPPLFPLVHLSNVISSLCFDLNLQEKNCFTIHEPRDVGEDCPPNFTIVVQNIYCHQQVPLAKVLFCDHREIPFPLEGNGTNTIATTVKYKELLQQVMAGRKESPMVQVIKEVTN